MTSCRRSPQGGVITGLIIVCVGVVLLLAQIGWFNIHLVWRFWPVILIMVGAGKLIEAAAVSQRVWGVMLIFIGALILAHYFGHFRYGLDQLWPLFVIGGGLSLLFQTYWPGRGSEYSGQQPGGSLRSFNVFGGTERNVKDRNFRGGNLFACFGGFQIDLTQADMEGESAVIDATAVFGGGEIRVPPSWNVIVEGVGVFGGYQDSTRHIPSESHPTKTLVVRGAAVFGGVEVKN